MILVAGIINHVKSENPGTSDHLERAREGTVAQSQKSSGKRIRKMKNSSRVGKLLWTLVAIYAVVVTIDELLSLSIPPAVPVLIAVVFSLIHGAVRYGWRGILTFLALSLVVGNAMENLSILTGFPFGNYHYTESLGPKLFLVPQIIGLAYFSTGYLAWMLATILVRDVRRRGAWVTTISVPVVASFIMVLWDLAFDPSASTVTKAWIWEDGGGYFGVPISNYLGWFLTVFVFYQSFALFLRFRKVGPEETQTLPRSFYAQPVALYAMIGLSFILPYMVNKKNSLITDAAGTVWSTASIIETKATVTLLTMIFAVALSVVKLLHESTEAPNRHQDSRQDDGVAASAVD